VTLERFPRRTLRATHTLYRIHREPVWWFSSDGGGRFDPVGTGMGACYWAERPLGAWVEVFRKRMLVTETEIAGRRVCSVTLGRDLRLADLTSRRALTFGVTASLGANEDHGPSQAFAVRAARADFDGVRYLARHDPSQRLYAVALFGKAGEWPAGDDREIPAELIAEAKAGFGYRVRPTP
jgi:RES domain-containing protein